MSAQPREAKVFAALLVSMTAGAIILMALGNNPPPVGAFCLNSYYRLEPIEKVISSHTSLYQRRWSYLEIYYSGTKTGDMEHSASPGVPSCPEDINCHFVIFNGFGTVDGQIQSTEKWQKQLSVTPARTSYVNGQTIRICIIADGKTTVATDFQIKRVEALVEGLSRKFNIQPESIYYPADWQ